jgi:HEAT repeat protein
MMPILLALPLLLPGFQGAQDTDGDLKFYRVHLRNGNVIDGELVKDSANEVLLRLKVGEMTIRRDQIESVEFVKMKSQDTKALYRPDPRKEPPKEAPKAPAKDSARTAIIEKINPEVRKKIDRMVWKLRTTPGDEKEFPLQELIALGDDASLYLAARVPDMDAKLHAAISAALINLKNPKILPILEILLNHDEGSIRAVAVTVAVMIVDGDAEKNRFIRPLVRDRDPSVRGTVMGLLSNTEDVEWFDAVSELCADSNADIRNRALNIMNRIAKKNEIQEKYNHVLTTNLQSRDEAVRSDILIAIGSTGKPENWKVVAPLLNDASPKVRGAAAQSLMTLGSTEAGPDIVSQVTRERDRWARICLAGAVQKLRLQKAIEPIIDWLADSDEDLKKIAAETLKLLTGERHGIDRDKWAAWYAAQPK